MNAMAEPALRVVDLFSGAGGLSEGFRQAGCEIVGAAELDPDAAATFALNFPAATVVTGDLRAAPVRERTIELARSADLLVGGPPCQAFSQVRNHTRIIDDPRNSLYREFVGVVREALPLAFVMENVTGMDQMGVREEIAADLSLAGEYRVLPQVLDAADFGVPQTRKRLLFIGVHQSLGLAPPRLIGTGATTSIALARNARSKRARYEIAIQEDALRGQLREALGNPEDLTVVTAAQAISDLAGLRIGNRDDEMLASELPEPQSAYQRLMRSHAGLILANVQVPRSNSDTVLRLRSLPPGGNHRDLEGALLDRYITGQRWGQDNGSGKLSRRHFYAYRRLHPDIWAWTLNTKADSVYHYRAARALSVREFARLQSFPDHFIFTTDARKGAIPGRIGGGAAHSRYRQVGNAVPPILASAAARALRNLLMPVFATNQTKRA